MGVRPMSACAALRGSIASGTTRAPTRCTIRWTDKLRAFSRYARGAACPRRRATTECVSICAFLRWCEVAGAV
uniref:Uncharacterized protein n=1 Tax=Ralstonia solanacearum TaxID=305 RepID=A0A0S4U2K4_RALSL|nr:protein of unknown function [Ralstonia solanacearum]